MILLSKTTKKNYRYEIEVLRTPNELALPLFLLWGVWKDLYEINIQILCFVIVLSVEDVSWKGG